MWNFSCFVLLFLSRFEQFVLLSLSRGRSSSLLTLKVITLPCTFAAGSLTEPGVPCFLLGWQPASRSHPPVSAALCAGLQELCLAFMWMLRFEVWLVLMLAQQACLPAGYYQQINKLREFPLGSAQFTCEFSPEHCISVLTIFDKLAQPMK